MTIFEEIDKAIGAHGMWKSRLRTAIDTGKLDTPVDVIKGDTHCAFGKWLSSGLLSPAAGTSRHFSAVKQLHAEFHRVASRVAELAVAGRKAEAEHMLDLDGEFAKASAKLTQAMMEWKRAIQ